LASFFHSTQIVKEHKVRYRHDPRHTPKNGDVAHCTIKNPFVMCGGGERARTDGLLRARQALSQLSYTPNVVGLDGFEPSTSRLSGVRSNQTELQAHGESRMTIHLLKEHGFDRSKLNSDNPNESDFQIFLIGKDQCFP
jgi:hypothetical protein